MEIFSALLTLYAVTGEFPSQMPVSRSFDVCYIALGFVTTKAAN